MLLLLIGVVAFGCVIALVVGPMLDYGLNDPPEYVSQSSWDRITERHVPHAPGFRRVK